MATASALSRGSCCSQFPYLPRRQPVLSSLRAIGKSSRQRVVVRAGEPGKTSLGASSPNPSIPSLQGITTQAVTSLTAPITSFDNNESGVVVRKDGRTIPFEMELWKDNGKVTEEMKEWIEIIRERIRSMTDGEISTSPYDTAWVALVPALDGSEGPQFPKCLEWILENQLPGGSWGDREYFSYYDRVCNTLACVIALKTWKIGSIAVEKGVKFIQSNLQALGTEEDAHMMIGFEIVFPTLLSKAKRLDLDLPYDAPIILKFSAERAKKLAKIPIKLLHSIPTTLLHSLEGFHEELDWKKLLKLQSEDGSFLCSPASTAACLLHTKDDKALGYLNRLLARFDNAVPNVYPVDLFEHMWVVDRLERLGIDRYFEKEIKDCLDYVYKYFTSFGIGWARGSVVQDLDDTAMGFRLLRQHGYDVNEDVFQQFRGKDGEFVCFAGQSGQAVTGLFNFYRAAQTQFPGDALLETGEHFARQFLEDRHERKQCYDKWIITKDLPGEVEYALTTPWYCSLPFLETEAYLRHYGPDDIWVGKSLYRMPSVNNETFMALARADFNLCQAKHQEDLQTIIRWSEHCEFGKLSFARQRCSEGVFTAVCVLNRPELSTARLVWAKNCVLTTVVDDLFDVGGILPDLQRFVTAFEEWNPSLMDGTSDEARIVFNGLYNTLDAIAQEGALVQGRDISHHLRYTWLRWLESILKEAEWTASAVLPSSDDYMNNAIVSMALEPIVLSTLFFLGEPITAEFVNDPEKLRLMDLTSKVGRLCNDIQGRKMDSSHGIPNAVSVVLRDNPGWTEEEAKSNLQATRAEYMRTLARDVHQKSSIPKSIRQLHFNMARIMHLFYQHTDGYTDHSGMAKLLKKVMKFN